MSLRIGVDVGGTNTDGVILDPSRSQYEDRGIVAWHKASTTPDPSDGIDNVIRTMFASSKIDPNTVGSVTIGTTHFINAVIENDALRLSRVAVVRLCGSFSTGVPPGIDWPPQLKNLICCHHSLLKGGLEVDGELIGEIDEQDLIKQAQAIKLKCISSIVVIGVFSPLDFEHKQEERAAEIIRGVYPEADIVLSKQVANLGFLERENAAILNASILKFARRTIRSFQQAILSVGLDCPLFITQNDGTILSMDDAARLPIRTFSSGPTNSMRGAAFLTQHDIEEAMIVVDIGGTTTDVGLLQASGLPRQAAAFSEVAGVRMNFSYPDVKSIGLGGGSLVRRQTPNKVVIGPQSVGHELHKAIAFGGTVATTTDYAVLDGLLDIGDRKLVIEAGLSETLSSCKIVIKAMLEGIIDRMKTSADDLPVLLVGGGAVLAPDQLLGASKVVKPKWSGIANAIGAATARVSGVVDTIQHTEGRTSAQVLQGVCKQAIDMAVKNGAILESVQIAEIENIPLAYIANKSRFVVKAVGDYDFERVRSTSEENVSCHEPIGMGMSLYERNPEILSISELPTKSLCNLDEYIPEIKDMEWLISEIDLDWITIGCYILGTGGGGTPYPHFLRLREMMRSGAIVKVIRPQDLNDTDLVAGGGGMGSPTVGMEKLQGHEYMQSQNELYDYMKVKPNAVIALEIGGGNGLQGMVLGASTNMNLPAIDGDWMGRAYPTGWQTTPVVFGPKDVFLPSTICDGSGNVLLLTKAKNEFMLEKTFRGALSQMGSHVACALGPTSGRDTKDWVVENTISQAWRIGRAVARCRRHNDIDNVAEAIISEVGGSQSAKVLFRGKIVAIERTLRMGHVYGELVVESGVVGDDWKETVKIPFKNENIMCKKINDTGDDVVLASVPDLISVIDAQDGSNLGTPEYRYGLQVIVLGIVASEKWTSTPRGLQFGGPHAFGLKDVEYKPLGSFSKPKSVIDEYANRI